MFGRKRSEKDFTEEIEAHLAIEADELERDGLSRDEAYRRARIEFGSAQAARERFHLRDRVEGFDVLVRDVKFALRQFVKHRAFTLTAVLTLAVGIGANAAIFTAIQSILLAPLPYNNPNRLTFFNTRWSDRDKTIPRVTGLDMYAVRDQAHSFEAISLYYSGKLGVQLRNHAAYTEVSFVDVNFARVFELNPIAGRLFTEAEAQRAALVSDQFARDNFGSARAALGQVLRIEDQTVEIVGVLPGGFDFPLKSQVWQARSLKEPQWDGVNSFNYRAVGLLRAGVSTKAAQTELDAISLRLQQAFPKDNRAKQMMAAPLSEALTGDARPTLLLLWATVGIILLIACVNVTHLQLVRSMERQREIAIRKALGSGDWQVIRPVIFESLLVALIGAAAGVMLALPAVRILVAMAPPELPRASEIHLNGWVLAFTAVIAMLTALASSVFPALRAMKVDAAEALKHDAARGMSRKGAGSLRDGLVVAEVAATFVLAVAAGLLLRTMNELMTRDLGFDTRQMLVVDADNPAHTNEEYQRALRQFDEIFANLSSVPGVEHVAGVMGLPTGPYGSNGDYTTHGGLQFDSLHEQWANFSVTSPGYFQAMGIPMLRGRDFSTQDGPDSPFAVVISEQVAKQSFGDMDPIGKQIQCGLDSDKWMTVIGVVGDVRQDSPAERPGPALYMPMAQHPAYANQIHIVLRTGVKPLTLKGTVQARIANVNPFIAMRFTTMDALVSESMTTERFRAVLISCFAGAGLLLAMLGVYGTTAYSVAQRTVEIGIRMAFGADRRAILSGILRRAALLAGCGIGLGLAVSFGLARLVASMLVGVRPVDPLSLATAALLLLATGMVAAFAPGWKATRIDPLKALRTE